MDKVSFGLSGVLGILNDTHITHDEFGQLGSMFYIGFLVFQVGFVASLLLSVTHHGNTDPQ